MWRRPPAARCAQIKLPAEGRQCAAVVTTRHGRASGHAVGAGHHQCFDHPTFRRGRSSPLLRMERAPSWIIVPLRRAAFRQSSGSRWRLSRWPPSAAAATHGSFGTNGRASRASTISGCGGVQEARSGNTAVTARRISPQTIFRQHRRERGSFSPDGQMLATADQNAAPVGRRHSSALPRCSTQQRCRRALGRVQFERQEPATATTTTAPTRNVTGRDPPGAILGVLDWWMCGRVQPSGTVKDAGHGADMDGSTYLWDPGQGIIAALPGSGRQYRSRQRRRSPSSGQGPPPPPFSAATAGLLDIDGSTSGALLP